MKINRFTIFTGFMLAFTFSLQGQPSDSTYGLKKSISVFDKPVIFTGWDRGITPLQNLKSINIGLFMPFDPEDPIAKSISNAANMGISEINSNGGYYGIPFCLKVRWSYNPWGAGSKEMIKLIYQDSVWAVIGSLDGNSTHIAQQIVTKAHVSLLSPLSADPTLTYIRIPWIFRLPPDFKTQAKVIAKQGIQSTVLKKIGLLTSTDHDGRTFAKEMINAMQEMKVCPIFRIEVSGSNIDFQELVQRIRTYETDAIIFYLPPPSIKEILIHLTNENQTEVLLPWIVGLQLDELSGLYGGKIYYIQPFLAVSNSAYDRFNDKYYKLYHVMATSESAYTYDSIQLLIHSIFKSGLSRVGIREAIAGINAYQGVTGKISWDNGGGNQTVPILRLLTKKQYP